MEKIFTDSVRKRVGLLAGILQRRGIDIEKRLELFKIDSPNSISTGSLIRILYYNNRVDQSQEGSESVRPQQFMGVLLHVKRHALEPTFTVRGVIDGVGVEQLFCINSPLIKDVQVIKASSKKSTRPLLGLRENPQKICAMIDRYKEQLKNGK